MLENAPCFLKPFDLRLTAASDCGFPLAPGQSQRPLARFRGRIPTPPFMSKSHAPWPFFMREHMPDGNSMSALLPEPGTLVSVSALNRMARLRLEASFPLMRIAGEISNLNRAPSGHLYFTLKDSEAQVRCTMWRNRAQLVGFRPENGMRVEVRALVTLYEVRGDFQLTVEAIANAGQGNLFEAFLRLKEKLGGEGLFDLATKRSLPRFPRRIGIVTSPTGAALQDVLASLRRRAPHLGVIVYPSIVQGASAAQELVRALSAATTRCASDEVDVVLLVRGGGSIEDLSAFNDEALARAIRACPVPVVSGVGHETDFTIADFAADHRATTPTMAAELASAGYHAATRELAALGGRLSASVRTRLSNHAQRLDRAGMRLTHPRERLARAGERIERLEQRLGAALRLKLERGRAMSALAAQRIHSARPRLEQALKAVDEFERKLGHAIDRLLQQHHGHLETLASHLEHLGPIGVLARGYSITRNSRGEIVRTADAVKAGELIAIQLAHGELAARVGKATPDHAPAAPDR